jgi:hypothetical protein
MKNRKKSLKMTSKYVLSAIVVTFALAFVVATPFVMAESGYGMHAYDGAKSHKGHWAISIGEKTGTVPITEEDTRESLKNQAISLSEAAEDYPDITKARLGKAVNDDGNYFLVWKLVSVDHDAEPDTKILTIYVLDAGTGDLVIDPLTIEFDKSRLHDKWSHYKEMKSKFADMTPEEREEKFAQHKEMRTAFESLSEQDQSTIKSYFQDMKAQFAEMTEEEMKAKHAELKEQMQEFMNLKLEEKISYLKYLAISQRNQA